MEMKTMSLFRLGDEDDNDEANNNQEHSNRIDVDSDNMMEFDSSSHHQVDMTSSHFSNQNNQSYLPKQQNVHQ